VKKLKKGSEIESERVGPNVFNRLKSHDGVSDDV
jgi:hypothetical protein